MARTIWKGAISFGLLHAPIGLYPAARDEGVDFDWLHRETLQPIGYKRVIKETGEEVAKEDIVRGVKYGDQYVVLSDEEIRAANVKSSHTIDLVGFTDAEDVNFLFFEQPYYLAPQKGGEKVYVLLREALLESKKIGVALVVLHNKQHLAALIATPHALVLNTLRWASEVKDSDELDLPPAGLKAASVKPKEIEMARQLIESMSEKWEPEQYRDTFHDDIMALVKKKYEAGEAHAIGEPEAEAPEEQFTETDLIELLRRSLQGVRPGSKPPPPATRKSNARSSRSAH